MTNKISELTRLKARLALRRKKPSPPPEIPAEPADPVPEPETIKLEGDVVYGEVLPSWDHKERKAFGVREKEDILPLHQSPQQREDFEEKVSKATTKHAKKRTSVTVSMSVEELAHVDVAASKAGLSRSAWVRRTLFKAMGRRPPARPKEELPPIWKKKS